MNGDKSFRQWRYAEADSIHLETVFKSAPGLKDKWMTNLSQDYSRAITPNDEKMRTAEAEAREFQAALMKQFQNDKSFSELSKFVNAPDFEKESINKQLGARLGQEAKLLKDLNTKIKKSKENELEGLKSELAIREKEKGKLMFQKFAILFLGSQDKAQLIENLKQSDAQGDVR